MSTEPIGEIVETSTTEWTAQACELERAPVFGALVRVDCPGGSIYGLVYQVRTGGLEPGAQAVIRGRSGVRDAAIFAENPDLRAVLRTDFAALTVGFRDGDTLRQVLPPHPPPLHWSVYECEAAELAAFAARLDYLGNVLAASQAPADELLAAHLRQARAARAADAEFPLQAGRELARRLNRDFARLSAILRRFNG